MLATSLTSSPFFYTMQPSALRRAGLCRRTYPFRSYSTASSEIAADCVADCLLIPFRFLHQRSAELRPLVAFAAGSFLESSRRLHPSPCRRDPRHRVHRCRCQMPSRYRRWAVCPRWYLADSRWTTYSTSVWSPDCPGVAAGASRISRVGYRRPFGSWVLSLCQHSSSAVAASDRSEAPS